MELQEAKSIFKIQDKFGQAELDTFYGFEKNLLLQKLSDEATEEELNEAQEALGQLERAYSVLSGELTSPTAVEEAPRANEERKAIPPLYIGIAIGLAVAALAYFFILPQNTPNNPSPQTTPIANTTATTPRHSNPKIDSRQYKLHKQPQEESMLTVLKQARAITKDWKNLIGGQDIQLPKRISSLLTDGEDYRSHNRFSQAQLAFEDYIRALKDHKKQFANYQNTFLRFDQLSRQWDQLAKANGYQFSRNAHYTEQFDSVKNELQAGKLPSHSRAVLDQICFIYETTIERGTRLAQQRKEYLVLRKQWEKNVLGSSFYTLTPATEELLATADQSPYYAEDFEYLQTQIYPRLLNHFKQHR